MARLMASMIGALAVATLLAQGIGVALLFSTGKLNDEKMLRILATVHDVPWETPDRRANRGNAESQPPLALSYEQIEQARRVRLRQLDLKTQSLEKSLEEALFVRAELTKDKERYERLKQSFENKLQELQEESESQGLANVRIVLENIKPRQARDLIMEMVENNEMHDVVHMLSEMPVSKRAKIVSEFTTEKEQETLDELLRLIRSGGAISQAIDEARDAVDTKP